MSHTSENLSQEAAVKQGNFTGRDLLKIFFHVKIKSLYD